MENGKPSAFFTFLSFRLEYYLLHLADVHVCNTIPVREGEGHCRPSSIFVHDSIPGQRTLALLAFLSALEPPWGDSGGPSVSNTYAVM